MYFKGMSYLNNLTDARVNNSSFDTAYLAQFKVGGIGKAFLSKPFCFSDFTQVPAKGFYARFVPCVFHIGNVRSFENFSLGKFALFKFCL